MSHRTAQTLFLGTLAAVALFAALRLGQGIFAPMLTGLVLGVVCAPIADLMERTGLPRTAASLLVLALLILLIVTLFMAMEPTISRAIRNAPEIWREMTVLLDNVRSTLAGVEDLQETVSEALADDDSPRVAQADAAPVAVPGVLDALALAPSFAAALMVFAGSFYFFLLSRTSLYRQIERSKLPWERIALERAEARVSRYFLTITVINASFGLLIWVVMTVVGMPNPMLWGLAAFLINYILYLGPALLAMAFLVGGIITFDGLFGVVPALIYVGMNMTEGQFVTPALVGRQMKVNPLLVFMSLVFWLWLWGPIGGIVAIPVLVWVLYLLGRLDRVEATPGPAPSIGPTGRKAP